MDNELPNEQIVLPESTLEPPFPVSDWQRVLYGAFVVFTPLYSFSLVTLLAPEWQSGKLQDYMVLFLVPMASKGFFIILAYSVVSYCLILINPDYFSKNFIFRFGVYTGVVLAFQYSVATLIYSIENQTLLVVIVLVWFFPIYFNRAFQWSLRKWSAKQVRSGILLFLVIGFIIAVIASPDAVIFMPLFALGMAGPFWSFLIATQSAILLFRKYEVKFNFQYGIGITVWLVGYIAAWRYDLLKAYELYSQLPTSPPDCYIATAAANGHPQFVHSWVVKSANGKSIWVNRQLQFLKCAELALLTINPHLHAVLRKGYDLVGKFLARKIQNPFLADVTYLVLKPFEWSTILILKSIIPEIEMISRTMYIK